MRSRGIEDAASPEAWLQQTLDEIRARVRRLLDVNGCAFQVVDWERKLIRPAAAWFADEGTREALAPGLTRPYDPEGPGGPGAAVGGGGGRGGGERAGGAAAADVRARVVGRRDAARAAARRARPRRGRPRVGL